MHSALRAAAIGYGLGQGCEFVAPLGKNKRNLTQMKEGIRADARRSVRAAHRPRGAAPTGTTWFGRNWPGVEWQDLVCYCEEPPFCLCFADHRFMPRSANPTSAFSRNECGRKSRQRNLKHLQTYSPPAHDMRATSPNWSDHPNHW